MVPLLKYVRHLFHEWRTLVGIPMLMLGIVNRMFPDLNTTPAVPFIARALQIVAAVFLFWATFAVYQKQVKETADLRKKVHTQQDIERIKCQKLLTELLTNRDAIGQEILVSRDDAYRSFENEDLCVFPTELLRDLQTYYQLLRGAQATAHYSPNISRYRAIAPAMLNHLIEGVSNLLDQLQLSAI